MNTTDQTVNVIITPTRLETQIKQLVDERDALLRLVETIRAGITPAAAYPETVAWLEQLIAEQLK